MLGKDIRGTNKRATERIKQVHGDMRVYAVVDPTRKFNVDIAGYVDKVFYDLGPVEWVDMLRNATFVFTDSFHGTLFFPEVSQTIPCILCRGYESNSLHAI